MTRDERQKITIEKLKSHGYNCGFIAGTGFGKTYMLIKHIKEINPNSTTVIVPTIKLKKDWEERIKKEKINTKIKVLVINSASKLSFQTEFLVVDEAHRSLAEQWSKIYNKIKFKFLIWTTATIERKDERELSFIQKFPIVDNISLEETVKNNWTSKLEIIKVPIELTEQEKKELKKINKQYDNLISTISGNPMKFAQMYIKYLNINNWVLSKKSNRVFFKTTIRNILSSKGMDKEAIERVIINNFRKPDTNNFFFKQALKAQKFYKLVNERKKFLYNVKNKQVIALKLINKFKDNYKFVISQNIDFLEDLATKLEENTYGLYHSKMKKKDKELFYKKFNDGRTKIKTLLSAKSLIEGIDIPKLEIGIITSYTSSKIDATQLRGRLSRLYKNKQPIIFYLYVKDSQEEKWLNEITKDFKTEALLV